MFRILQIVTLLQLLVTVSAALAADRPVVREVLVIQKGNGARIEIRADQPLAYKSYLMPELAKWVIDLPGAKTTYSGDESKLMRTPPLERLSVRQKDVNGDLFTRIGLDFKGDVDFSIKEDPLDKGHLVALMTPSKATQQKRVAAASMAALPQSDPTGPKPAAAGSKPSVASPAPVAAAKTVTAVSITADSIRIEADGRVTVPAPLVLSKPGRLVLDLAGVTGGQGKITVPANRFGIVRSRLGNNAGKLRIVFEVSGDAFPGYQMKEIPNGVEITPASAGL
jgi:hypothetical protein